MRDTPQSFTAGLEEQGKLTEKVDAFFKETIEHLKKQHPLEERPEGFRRETRILEHPTPAGRQTNDHIEYLLYEDFITAGVLKTRTEANHVRYTFFRSLEGFKEYFKRFFPDHQQK